MQDTGIRFINYKLIESSPTPTQNTYRAHGSRSERILTCNLKRSVVRAFELTAYHHNVLDDWVIDINTFIDEQLVH